MISFCELLDLLFGGSGPALAVEGDCSRVGHELVFACCHHQEWVFMSIFKIKNDQTWNIIETI